MTEDDRNVPPLSPDGGGKPEATTKPAEERAKEAGFVPPSEQQVAAFMAALAEKVVF